MHSLFVCLFLVTVVGILDAAPYKPQPCCMPDQMEFTTGETIAYSREEISGLTQLKGRGAVDYKKQLLAFREEGYSDGRKFNMTVIEDFTNQLMYLIDESKGSCVKSKLPSSEMSMQCLPDDATYIETIEYGLGTTVSGEAWDFNFKDEVSKTELNVYVVVQPSASDKSQCVPIVESVKGRMGDTGIFMGASFFNLKDSISDPSVFNIPDICKKDGVPLVSSLPASPFQNYMVKKYQKL